MQESVVNEGVAFKVLLRPVSGSLSASINFLACRHRGLMRPSPEDRIVRIESELPKEPIPGDRRGNPE